MKITENEYKKLLLSISMKVYEGEIPATNDVDIIAYALNKRIGKKYITDKSNDGKLCPCCKHKIHINDKYCNQCGQKIIY